MREETLERILTYLTSFLKGGKRSFSEDMRRDKTAIHYYSEIIRYWNKINFVLNYTLRALNYKERLKSIAKSALLFVIYRYYWEGSVLKEIVTNINPLFQKNEKPFDKRILTKFYNKLETFSWKRAFDNKSVLEKISIDRAIPTFFLNKLNPYLKLDFIIENVKKMDSPEKLKPGLLILNHGEKAYESIFDEFKTFLSINKISFSIDPEIDTMMIISSNNLSEILNSKFYQEGKILVLDRGSAYIVNLFSKGANEKILDMCSAPGIKTILLFRLVDHENKILAIDFSLSRTCEMKQVLTFYDYSNISVLNSDSINPPMREGCHFDKILLDAPCTGSGTFSTNPELKWRQNHAFLNQNVTLQEKLLASAIKLLKPSGTLLYSTCSFYAEEGELQIQKFQNELIPMEIPDFFSPSYEINSRIINGTGRLFPAIQGTKGFFVGKFKKKEL